MDIFSLIALSKAKNAESKSIGVYHYKGSVATESALPSQDNVQGDVWNIVDTSTYGPAGTNVAWDGTAWDALGGMAPVTSVNGQTGAVVLDAADVGAEDEALVVTYTLGSTVTCDKTYSEIMTALQAKQPIRAYGVQDGFVAAALTTVAAGSAIVFTLPTGATTAIRIDHLYNDTISYQEETAISEVTLPSTGAVSQALAAGVWYHFTGSLTSLTLTLDAAASGQLAQYHFDFTTGSSAPTVTLPSSVIMPDDWSVDANTHYEVDILNNYAVVVGWAVSA